MTKSFEITILFCTPDKISIKKNFYHFLVNKNSCANICELETYLKEKDPPDFILPANGFGGLEGGDLVLEIKKHCNAIPLILLCDHPSIEFINEVFAAGADDVLDKSNLEKELLILFSRLYNHKDEQEANDFLIKNFATLTANLQEKNTIFETMVDLLSHDTKNMFFYILTLTSQMTDPTLKAMMEDAVQELNNTVTEASGYLRSKKRIDSVLNLVNKIRLTQDRISILSHPRIKITHDPKFLLFVEVSSLFKNAIINIVENALKYTPETSEVKIHLKRTKTKVQIFISDHGKGIDDRHKDKIFDRFVRLEQTINLEGSGRGLWITKNIIEKEKGSIIVKDNEGGGTIFRIEIPPYKLENLKKELNELSEWYHQPASLISQKEQTIRTFLYLQKLDFYENLPEEEKESIVFANLLQLMRDEARTRSQKHFYKKLLDLKTLNPNGKSVLIVDDSIYVHYYLGAHFTELGFKIVGFANTGTSGVSYYNALQPDIVTMDYTMPEMSGALAAKKIIETNPQAKILFVTGAGDHPRFITNLKTTIPNNNYRVLTKPFKKEDLSFLISSFL